MPQVREDGQIDGEQVADSHALFALDEQLWQVGLPMECEMPDSGVVTIVVYSQLQSRSVWIAVSPYAFVPG
jgi:hypothetical protein